MNKNNKQNILLVPSKKNSLQDVAKTLSRYFENVIILDEKQAFKKMADVPVELIFTHYSVSDMTGILFFKKLAVSSAFSLIPTIFVSESQTYDHVLNAFEMGAADFLQPPFKAKDLYHKSLLHLKNRRIIEANQNVQMGNLHLNIQLREVCIDENPITLTETEFKILSYLLLAPHQVVTREEIVTHIWGVDLAKYGRLETQLCNLKKKIHPFSGKIKTINKIGLRLVAEGAIFAQEPMRAGRQPRHRDPHP